MRQPVQHTIAEGLELPPDEYVVWAPFPGFQTEVLAATEFELFIGGAKGPGKSDLIYIKAAVQAEKEAYKGLVLRESFPEIEELIRRAQRTYGQIGAKWQAKESQFQFYGATVVGSHYQGGQHLGIVKFGYCSRLKDVERYQGQEWAYVGMDEMANLADERVATDLMKEIRCPNPDVWLQFMGSGNPGFAGQAWCKRRYPDKCGKHGETVYEYEVEIPVFDGGREVGTQIVLRHRRFIPGRVQDNPIYANDPNYMATLLSLPEERKRQMFYGDWDAGMGMALGEVSEDSHIVTMAPGWEDSIPDHWDRFGALDWGFTHRWSFGAYVMSPLGVVYKLDTLTGRREYPREIANKILGRFPGAGDWHLVAGTDLHARPMHMGEDVPSRAEEFIELGLPFQKADTRPGSRVSSLNNLRQWVKWKRQGPGGKDGRPALLFADTPGNRWCVRQLMDMVSDPKNPEDALKVDCDPETGEGGDDAYDETRMALAARPYTPPDPAAFETHTSRVHKKSREVMRRIQQAQERDEYEASEADEAMLPEEMQSDPWLDVMS